VRRLALAAALALLPLAAGAQGLGCPEYIALTEDQRALVARGLLSGYVLGATIAQELSLSAATDDRLGPGLRAASSELARPLTRLQGKTPRQVADELRVECGRPQSMTREVAAAFAAMIHRPPERKPVRPAKPAK
jgi:hypothetical protein